MPRIRIVRSDESALFKVLEAGLPHTFARLADVYRRRGEHEKAIELCREGISRFPNYPTGHIVLGQVHMDRGEAEAALVEFHSALKCDPGNLLALSTIADVHQEAGSFSIARSYYRQVLQRDRSNARTKQQLRRKKPEPEKVEPAAKAPETVGFFVGKGPERGEMKTVTLAELYLKQGHGRLAAEICRGVLDAEPENERALRLMAEIEGNV